MPIYGHTRPLIWFFVEDIKDIPINLESSLSGEIHGFPQRSGPHLGCSQLSLGALSGRHTWPQRS